MVGGGGPGGDEKRRIRVHVIRPYPHCHFQLFLEGLEFLVQKGGSVIGVDGSQGADLAQARQVDGGVGTAVFIEVSGEIGVQPVDDMVVLDATLQAGVGVEI